MAKKKPETIDHEELTLDGKRYVVLRESEFRRLCRAAGIDAAKAPEPDTTLLASGLDADRQSLAEKLRSRRHAARLSQAELARRAGIRPETLNRIERGRTTPDFTTIRKLVEAIGAAETD
ncbi:MAG TPA: hypothetical protein DD670_15725 [Planctomycetaceae bacterium]|nr:hypothetical protein [Planctomycetaceae bacterium]